MPYRRLPNTDSARLKALKTAKAKAKDLPPFKLAFSQGVAQKIDALLPSYETLLSDHKIIYNLQLEKNKEYNRLLRKVRMYISHFIQVVNMAVMRGDMPANTCEFFGLDPDGKKLPSLTTDEEVMEWGRKLIHGEAERRMKNLTPVMNPTIALVKVHFDKFAEAYNFQNNLDKRQNIAQESLQKKRAETDQLIQTLWNEIEATYSNLPEDLRREKATDYGLVYVFRKNELSSSDLLRVSAAGIG
jgi:hypothetical protein